VITPNGNGPRARRKRRRPTVRMFPFDHNWQEFSGIRTASCDHRRGTSAPGMTTPSPQDEDRIALLRSREIRPKDVFCPCGSGFDSSTEAIKLMPCGSSASLIRDRRSVPFLRHGCPIRT
ncbi:MAG: hypothetical protein OET79_06445, partial [Nitrospirota bacterium]|nr:hypothetical protein [Nitrospirota bacterium]